jgi:hypothetical protein
MNLRELLLQFAGENDVALKLDEIITSDIRADNISIVEDIGNGVRAVLLDDTKREETVESIKELLTDNGYEKFHIYFDEELMTIEV